MEKIQELQNIGWEIVDTVLSQIEVGMSELDAFSILESELSSRSITKIWHPSIIKFDTNTTKTSLRHKPSPDAFYNYMAVIDLGLVIDGCEIDCGKSMGATKACQQLAKTAQVIFNQIKSEIILNTDQMNPSKIYNRIDHLAEQSSYKLIAPSAGHLIGPYPTPKKEAKIVKNSDLHSIPKGYWMIEIYIGNGEFAAFFEDLIILN